MVYFVFAAPRPSSHSKHISILPATIIPPAARVNVIDDRYKNHSQMRTLGLHTQAPRTTTITMPAVATAKKCAQRERAKSGVKNDACAICARGADAAFNADAAPFFSPYH